MVLVGLIIGVIIVLKIVDKCCYIFICFILFVYLYVIVNYVGYWMVCNVYFNFEVVGYSVLNGVLLIIMLLLGFIIIVVVVKKWV